MLYSIIIPYQHQPDRIKLLDATIGLYLKYFGRNRDIEICVHEVGPKKTLPKLQGVKYAYTFSDFPFHRAWAFNEGIRKLATGERLVLSDSDLWFEKDWASELLRKRGPAYAWGMVGKLNKQGTQHLLKTGLIDRGCFLETHPPSSNTDAGRVFLIPRDIFKEIGGMPEDFKGTWGGEDNAFAYKILAFGYRIGRFSSWIYHLYHEDTTPRVSSIRAKAVGMRLWTKRQWIDHMDGVEVKPIEKPKILVRLVSWNRPNKLKRLLRDLPKSCNLPLALLVRIQGAEKLDHVERTEIARAAGGFYQPKIYYTEGNVGTALAQRDVYDKAKELNYDYQFFTDDDMIIPKGGIEHLLKILEGRPELGGAELKSSGRFLFKVTPEGTIRTPISHSPDPQPTDFVGTGASLLRRSAIEKFTVDTSYFIGLWDWDCCMQLNRQGISFVTVFRPDLVTVNDGGDDIGAPSGSYTQVRYYPNLTRDCYRVFINKWGFDPDRG